MAHHDPVCGGRRAKDLRHSACFAQTFAAAPGQAIEMRIARRDLTVKRGDSHHGTVKVLVGEPNGAQHSAVRSAAGAAGRYQTGPRGVIPHRINLGAYNQHGRYNAHAPHSLLSVLILPRVRKIPVMAELPAIPSFLPVAVATPPIVT
jgi:hypothetical protein